MCVFSAYLIMLDKFFSEPQWERALLDQSVGPVSWCCSIQGTIIHPQSMPVMAIDLVRANKSKTGVEQLIELEILKWN